ncbi:MAG: ATP-binding protein [Bacteroidales bacterium]|nr:ATP-binding protein [Bacteroidales bacterium]
MIVSNHIIRFLSAIAILLTSLSCSKESTFTSVQQNGDIILSSSLSNQNVNVFYEDSKGYIWMGTDVGLNRYDGESFIQFLSSPSDSMSLVHSKVYNVYEDSRGRIWAGTRMGISCLRPDLKWDRYKMNASSTNIFDIYENSRGEVYAGNRWSLLKEDPETKSFNEVTNFIVYDNLYSKTCLDSSDDIWLVQDHRIVQYNGTTYEKVRTMDVGDRIVSSLMDNNDRLWILYEHSIGLFDTKRFCFEPAPKAISSDTKILGVTFRSIYKFMHGFVFLTEDDDLFYYNVNTERLSRFNSSRKSYVTTYFMDRSGYAWIGVHNGGFVMSNNSNQLSEPEMRIQSELLGSSIDILSKGKDGDLWALSNTSEITKLDYQKGEVVKVDISKVFPNSSTRKVVINSILSDKHESNCIWVLSGGVLYQCSLDGSVLKCVQSYRFPVGSMTGLFEDSLGRVFVYGQGFNMYYINPGQKDYETIIASTINLTQVTDMLETSDGEILFCCNYRNIYKIDFENLSEPAPEVFKGFSSNYEPTCMIQDNEGKIWVTANGSSIKKFTPGYDTYEDLNFDASYYNNSILDDGNYMWIGSQRGLYRYEKSTGKYSVFYAGDVIVGNQFNTHSSCKLDNGNLAFGGSNGITIFNPKYEPTLTENVSLAVEFIQAGETLYYNYDDLSGNSRISVKPSDNDVTIHYSALSNNDYLHLRYEYKMDGVDSDWHYVHAERDAHYAHLPYGKNRFQVRVVLPGRVQTGIESTVDVFVKRPILISTVAKFLYLALFALIVALFLRMMKHTRDKEIETELIKREKEQQVLLNERNVDYFTSISHEFRTPLTMILGAADSIISSESNSSGSTQYSKILYRNVRRMQKLVDQLLDVSKLESGSLKLSARLQDILPKAKDIVEAFGFSAKAKSLDVSLECTEDTILGYLDEDVFEKVMYNLLSNAVKYTPQGGSITVKVDVIGYDKAVDKFRVASEDSYIRIKVIDSGVGIPEDKRDVIFNKYYQVQTNKAIGGTGIGLYFTKMLLTLHHGDVICEASLDKDGKEQRGTQFTFVLPLNEKSYTKEEITDAAPIAYKANPAVLSEFVESSPVGDVMDSDKPLILAIDDDPEVLHYIKSLLSPYYRMVLRFDATTGYEAIGQFSPDVIISDVLMLDVDGFEFCRMVKDNAEYSHIPVILLTAKNTTEDQIKGVEAHAEAYVTKPFEPSFLKALIKSMLEKKAEAKKVLAASTISTKERLDEVLKEKDRQFIEDVYKFMEAELENEELNVTAIYEQMYMSRTKFYNKMKSLTGETPGNFFRTYKLNRAKELLETGEYKIAAVAVMTGFCSASHFSTLFKKQFGITPTEFISGKPIQ